MVGLAREQAFEHARRALRVVLPQVQFGQGPADLGVQDNGQDRNQERQE